MNKKVLLLLILFIAAVGFVAYSLITSRTGAMAGLRVVSTPQANVFWDDKLVGKTPYEDKKPPGEYILKVIPESTTPQVVSWQGKIQLNPSILTYVNRELGLSELASSGEILTLEKISQNQSQLAVFSQPDGASVLIDGQDKGITPVFIGDISPGEHDVAVASTGFTSRTVRVQTNPGYKLVVNFQLGIITGTEATQSAAPTPTGAAGKEIAKPYVVIKDTPTGFLRVRSDASTSADELAQVKPGEKYPFVEEKEGWYKITYKDTNEGWIASRYATKVE